MPSKMEHIQEALRTIWGYDDFLPLQREAMESICRGRDSIVVLPTGGGKSLCFQAPAVALPGLAVVVSPLISLMKDQVDALTECGVPARRLDSSLTAAQRDEVRARIRSGQLKLLYLSPERLLSNGFAAILRRANVSFIAIDEAHCVSMWGHDFRPEYRRLESLKRMFPGVTLAAYTATATEPVRRDIARQLQLDDPEMHIGSFDRPNLVYKVRPRRSIGRQVSELLDRHRGESGIIYCIRRQDVDSLCTQLIDKGYRAAPYHAGMTDEQRRTNQDRFIRDQIDVIVATIAFGMGIDKSNVRYVVHTGMPKSLEHYQQESGRAGRDGLEAECCLFYSGADYGVWKGLMSRMPAEALSIALAKLNEMYRYCSGGLCRHRAILRYFGQDTGRDDCGACDLCLGELDCLADSLVVAQKILSCIVRLDQRFGGHYTALVLAGSRDKRIRENGHHRLSTYGLLGDHDRRIVHDWIDQLAGQGYIEPTGEYHVLSVTEKGWGVLRGEHAPRLLQPTSRRDQVLPAPADSWQDVDRGLYETLRAWRTAVACEKGVPAYVVFGDAALRDMARRRPSTPAEFLDVKGVGQKKCRQYGERILAIIRQYAVSGRFDPAV